MPGPAQAPVCTFVELVTAVREARESDLEAVAGIYAAAALTPATFDLEGRPVQWWREVLAAADPAAGHLLLVAERDGEVAGYAKSGAFKVKPAYHTTVEISAYVHADHRGAGVGDALYTGLFERLDATPLRLAVAGVTRPNEASDRLHRRHGFTEVGTFHGVGVKLGRAWDVQWLERPLRGAADLEDLAGMPNASTPIQEESDAGRG